MSHHLRQADRVRERDPCGLHHRGGQRDESVAEGLATGLADDGDRVVAASSSVRDSMCRCSRLPRSVSVRPPSSSTPAASSVVVGVGPVRLRPARGSSRSIPGSVSLAAVASTRRLASGQTLHREHGHVAIAAVLAQRRAHLPQVVDRVVVGQHVRLAANSGRPRRRWTRRPGRGRSEHAAAGPRSSIPSGAASRRAADAASARSLDRGLGAWRRPRRPGRAAVHPIGVEAGEDGDDRTGADLSQRGGPAPEVAHPESLEADLVGASRHSGRSR